MFAELVEAFHTLSLEEKVADGNPVLCSKAHNYTGEPPSSKLVELDMPFLFAKVLGFPHKKVLRLSSETPLERLLKVYENEIDEVKSLLQELASCGIHVIIRLRNKLLITLLQKYKDTCKLFRIVDGTVHVIIPKVSTCSMTPKDVQILCCLLHLMCFSEHGFIFRKRYQCNKSCYLLLNAYGVGNAVVADGDLKLIGET